MPRFTNVFVVEFTVCGCRSDKRSFSSSTISPPAPRTISTMRVAVLGLVGLLLVMTSGRCGPSDVVEAEADPLAGRLLGEHLLHLRDSLLERRDHLLDLVR